MQTEEQIPFPALGEISLFKILKKTKFPELSNYIHVLISYSFTI